MAEIAPHGVPTQGQPMTPPATGTGTVAPQGGPATPGTTLPGSGPQPTNLPGVPPDWNSFPRIARAILNLFEQQGKAAADELEAWIRMKLGQK